MSGYRGGDEVVAGRGKSGVVVFCEGEGGGKGVVVVVMVCAAMGWKKCYG